MPSWIHRLFGAPKSPTSTPAVPPPSREPYEWPKTDGPSAGKLFRPIVYALEHQILPGLFFERHPEICRLTSQQPESHLGSTYCWVRSLQWCQERDLIRPEASHNSQLFARYLEQVGSELESQFSSFGSFGVFIVRTPQPVAATETHWVALCQHQSDARPYDGKPSTLSRYFTLEAAGDGEHSFFCEWTADRNHPNFGPTELHTKEHFFALIQSALRRTEA